MSGATTVLTDTTPTLPTKSVGLRLIGLDGNAFYLLGAFARQARKEGWTGAEIAAVRTEATKSDYDHLLRTLMAFTHDPDDEDEDEDSN